MEGRTRIKKRKGADNQRMQIYTTGTATAMNTSTIWWIRDTRFYERGTRTRLSDHRTHDRREFFLIAPLFTVTSRLPTLSPELRRSSGAD